MYHQEGRRRGFACRQIQGAIEDETVIVGTFYGNSDVGIEPFSAPEGFFIARYPK